MSAVPLELQRRIVNTIMGHGGFATVLLLAVGYAGVALAEQNSAVAVALGVGGWFVLQERMDIGAVVAIVGGLGKLNDPWADLVNWSRGLSIVGVKYRLFADVVNRSAAAAPPNRAPTGRPRRLRTIP